MLRFFSFVFVLFFLPSLAQSDEVVPPGSTSIDSNGNIVFAVQGDESLRISSQTAICVAATEGAMRFNKTTKKFEGCDGTAWKALGSDNGVAIGSVAYFTRADCPDGYVEANGGIALATAFPALVSYLGTQYGANGQLPDLRGEFIRGWDHGRTADAARAFGSPQADALKSHTHTINGYPLNTTNGSGASAIWQDDPLMRNPIASNASGSTETRPRNVALMPCIKY